MLKWYPVQSGVFSRMAYRDGNIYVQFRRNGDIWVYFGMSPEMFVEFLNAPSMGRYFVKQIKGRLPSRRLTKRRSA